MDLEDTVREIVRKHEFRRRDKMGDRDNLYPEEPDYYDVNDLIDNMSNSEFLQIISEGLERWKA